ncbi:ASPIC/UnbV domain-containing protein [Aurantiacibacter sp. MUD61]|uniref:ASPIC/UnbV domain-containing protein n=1 Tax=Aurantiacibacter sp. MUD61 TaxID=3009083 RepID=UPI0022F088AB|nr:ASPIC/UnbV domain-containing protein [Aurantiacibacter sp. MUD61]
MISMREAGSEKRSNSRIWLSVAVIAVLVCIFWKGSRYPALNEKAMMGGDTPLSGLSFDIIFDFFPDSPLYWAFAANVGSWIVTNWKGMTFGVLFGAAILTLLSVIRTRSFKNGFANAALGATIGAPLGVCVNCAAPIALGLHMGRMRLETTLAALIASLTLNVIVVTMSFALLPLHVAATKLLLSLLLILLIAPLLCRSYDYVSFDYDRDGDIDIVRDNGAIRMIVHRNDRPAGNGLWVSLRDAMGNSMGIGARVIICTGEPEIAPGNGCQMRQIKASGGYQSFDPIAAHFGIGEAREATLIAVTWPDGKITEIRGEEALSGEIIMPRAS